MQSNRLTQVLVLLFSASACCAALLAMWHVRLAGRIQVLQRQITQVDQNRTLALTLGNEAVEYGRKNPDIRPILESVMVRPQGKPGTAATVQPGKP